MNIRNIGNLLLLSFLAAILSCTKFQVPGRGSTGTGSQKNTADYAASLSPADAAVLKAELAAVKAMTPEEAKAANDTALVTAKAALVTAKAALKTAQAALKVKPCADDADAADAGKAALVTAKDDKDDAILAIAAANKADILAKASTSTTADADGRALRGVKQSLLGVANNLNNLVCPKRA